MSEKKRGLKIGLNSRIMGYTEPIHVQEILLKNPSKEAISKFQQPSLFDISIQLIPKRQFSKVHVKGN